MFLRVYLDGASGVQRKPDRLSICDPNLLDFDGDLTWQTDLMLIQCI